MTKEYNERTRTDPGNESLWLSFATFQGEFLVLSKRRNKVKGSAAIAAKKIAILEAGVRANPKSERLLYAHLELCAEVWEHGHALTAWRAAVAQHPASLRLWRRYLRFSIGTFASFSLSAATTAYAQAFRQLSERSAAALVESQRGGMSERRHRARAAELEKTHFGLVLDWSALLHRAGFTERAVGLLQAAVELNWFTPQHLAPATGSGHTTRLRFLEAFWESEAPRLGDDGAEGWGTWLLKAQERLATEGATTTAAAEATGEGQADTYDPIANNYVEEGGADAGSAGDGVVEELGLGADGVDEWDRSDDDDGRSEGEEEEEAALLEAESAEAAAERAAMAAAKEVEGAEAEDVRRLLHWGSTETQRASSAWRPLAHNQSPPQLNSQGCV